MPNETFQIVEMHSSKPRTGTYLKMCLVSRNICKVMIECTHLCLIYKHLDILHVSSVIDEVRKPGTKCRVFDLT